MPASDVYKARHRVVHAAGGFNPRGAVLIRHSLQLRRVVPASAGSVQVAWLDAACMQRASSDQSVHAAGVR